MFLSITHFLSRETILHIYIDMLSCHCKDIVITKVTAVIAVVVIMNRGGTFSV